MKVFYYQAPGGNVGDDLNGVLWQRLLPDLQQLTAAQWLVGAGTTLDGRLNALEGRKIIMGTGLRPNVESWPDGSLLRGDVRFGAVRGRLTAQMLGLEPELALCDPGFLVDRVWPVDKSGATRVGLVPHVYSERWSHIAEAAADAGLEVISPRLPVEEFLRRLGTCARVYCESLHAAIFADALRIPWARTRICSHYYEGKGVSEFKWQDTFSVLGTSIESATRATLIPVRRRGFRFVQVFAERRLVRELLRRSDDAALFGLSPGDRLQEQTEALLDKVQQLRSPENVERWRAAPRSALRLDEGQRRVRVLAFPKDNGTTFLRKYSAMLQAEGADLHEFSYRCGLLQRYEVFHIHWPDSHLLTSSWWRALGKHARLALLMLWLRARGTRIVWTMHNLKPHEKNHWLSSWLFPLWFPRLCTHVIALTANGLSSATSMYPPLRHKASAVIPHGHYRDEYPPAPSRETSCEQLGLPRDRFTILFFGNVRKYKNVPLLIQAFRGMVGEDVQLIIAGEPGPGVSADEIARLAQGDARIHLHLRFIPESQVPMFFGTADLVALPFDSILNSGSVLLALSFDRMVIAPRLGSLPEIHSKVGSRWLRLYDGPLTTELLEQARAAQSAAGSSQRPDLSAFEWTTIAARTLDLYRLEARPHPGRTRGRQYESSLQTRRQA